MKCPHCSQSIGFFSKALNSWGKAKQCPKCGGGITIYVSWKWAGILFVPALIASLLANRVLGGLGSGLVVAILLLLCMRLKAA
jgi:hypothetical protein